MTYRTIAPAVVVIVASTFTARAEPKPKPVAPSPCVNRAGAGRNLHHVKLDAATLRFCTGKDCWTLDLARSTIKTAPSTLQVYDRVGKDNPGELLAADGRVIATATATEVAFCPRGSASCQRYKYKFKFEPQTRVAPAMNPDATLGAVVYSGVSEDGDPSYVLLFDLAKQKPLGRVDGWGVEVLRSSFLIENSLYTAGGKLLAKLALPDSDGNWVAIPTTDLLALSRAERGEVRFQDATTGRAKPTIKLGIAHANLSALVKQPTADGKRLYVIAEAPFEGEVFAIDVAANTVVARVSPPVCGSGTYRP